MEDKPLSHEHYHAVTLSFLAEPTDANVMGKMHGGVVMKWIDQAAYVCAAGWCGRPCVTVYVGGIRFYQPIPIGSLVEVHARLIYTHRTSMHMAVDVRAADPRTRIFEKTTHCVTVFVALDEQGKPAAVPVWKPQTEEEIAMEKYALRLMALRKGVEEEMRPYIQNP
jgi:acyl-CoA hydrolase